MPTPCMRACAWAQSGDLLASLELGFQVSALDLHPLGAAVGGAAGELQMLIYVTDEAEAKAHRAALPEQELAAARTAPAKPAQYEWFFDARGMEGAGEPLSMRACGSHMHTHMRACGSYIHTCIYTHAAHMRACGHTQLSCNGVVAPRA